MDLLLIFLFLCFLFAVPAGISFFCLRTIDGDKINYSLHLIATISSVLIGALMFWILLWLMSWIPGFYDVKFPGWTLLVLVGVISWTASYSFILTRVIRGILGQRVNWRRLISVSALTSVPFLFFVVGLPCSMAPCW